MERREWSKTVRSPPIAWGLATVVALAAWTGLPATEPTARILSITLFCIVLWILTPIPPSYTGVIGIGLIGVAFSTELALGGFRSPATWLIGFGLLMGEATRRSGLANWGGRWITAKSVPTRLRSDPVRTYRRLLVALSLGAHALALFVPSALVRVLVLAPILRETGARFDSRDARVGLFLGPLFATFYGSAGILTADLPNIIVTGIGQSVAGHAVSWTEWATHMYPVMGLTRVLLVVAIVFSLYRPDPETAVQLPGTDSPPMGDDERRMLVFLIGGALVWATDFVHGFHPVVGAIVVVSAAFLPTVGVVDFENAVSDVDFSILFFIGAIFAIGDGLARTGFADAAAESLLGEIPRNAPLAVILGIVFFVALSLSFLMEGLAVASVLTPILVQYADAAGVPLTPVLMVSAMPLSTYFFPYQSAVLIAILAEDVADSRDLVVTTSACSIASILLLLPLQLLVFSVLY